MDTQENKTENSENKEVDFKVDFRKIISNNRILVIAITGFIIVITLLYFIADEKSHNNFGDYFGGVLNPILAFISFIAILWTVALQRKSIELQSKELRLTREELEETREELKRSGDAQEKHTKLFEQQQFETTFFNILELLRSYSKKEPLKIDISGKNEKFTGKVSFPNKWTEQYPLTLLSLLDSVEDFTNDKKERTKYINIVKVNLDGQAFLITLLTYKSNFMSNQHQIYYPYPELKDRIEKYALFDVIPKAVIKDFPEFAKKADYDNIIKFFKLSAFGNNYYLLADRINLEEEPDELVRYATSPYKVVRSAVAKNHKTPIEILEQLAKDEEKEVRQAVADNTKTPQEILRQLANDNEKEVRVAALGNSNISQQTLKNELEKNYNELNSNNIKEIIYIIFNNSKVYDIDKMFNQYITSVISFMQQQSNKGEYEIMEIFLYYMREVKYKHMAKKIFIKSIENILDNKNQIICFRIIESNEILNYICTLSNEICNKIIKQINKIYRYFRIEEDTREITTEERKEKITSVFKEHETELREFIEQLKK